MDSRTPGAFGQAAPPGAFQMPAPTTSQIPSAPFHESPPVAAMISNSVEHREAATIQELFNVCVRSISDMMRYDTPSHELLAKTMDRLSRWHQGLFNSVLELEVILAERDAEAKRIRKLLLSCLVDIANAEGK